MASSNRDADHLAKAIYPYLVNNGFVHRALEEAGWFAFIDTHRPVTSSAVTMACHAFRFLCIDGNLPNMKWYAAKALIAYLKAKTGQFPNEDALRVLKKLLDVDPCNGDHVSEWFHRNYTSGGK